jgi:hypothetical protein
LCGVEIWTFGGVDQKYLESFEMWCWRRMEKINFTDRVRNYEVLQSQGEDEYPATVNRRKANWNCHILRRNCLLIQVI